MSNEMTKNDEIEAKGYDMPDRHACAPKINMLVYKLHPDSKLPFKATPYAVGYDVYSYGHHEIEPGEIKMIPTGIRARVEYKSGNAVVDKWMTGLGPASPLLPQYEIQVRPRSGYASRGLTVVNAPGTVDPDYRGEIMVIMINHSKETFNIENGDRIAQLVIQEMLKTTVIDVDEERFVDDITTRGDDAFGSTGK